MARKHYSDEFRRDAVELYQRTPGATVRAIAADLGIERGTLAGWIGKYGTGRKTADDGTPTISPVKMTRAADPVGPETVEARLARLEAENTALRAEKTKLTAEREILRKAAKYFAGETHW